MHCLPALPDSWPGLGKTRRCQLRFQFMLPIDLTGDEHYYIILAAGGWLLALISLKPRGDGDWLRGRMARTVWWEPRAEQDFRGRQPTVK